MTAISAAFTLLILAQAPVQPAADRRVQAIEPFVGSDVFAVLEVELARADFPALAVRVLGESPSGPFTGLRDLQWPEALRRAGAKELYFVFSMIDMTGQPFVVVPLTDGADAAEISKLFQPGGKARGLVGACESATVHNAVFAGKPAALERVRRAVAAPRPELAAAFAAAEGRETAARLVLIPSADTRRVLEEMIPSFPAELGGGPITDLSRGLLWTAIAVDTGPQPQLRVMAESKDAGAAQSLQRLAENLRTYLVRSPDLQKLSPELPKILADLNPTVDGSRVTLTVDAKQAASLADSVTRPARQAAMRSQCVNNEKQIGLAIHNYISVHGAFPPAFTQDKAGKPLLSWRVLILPYLEQDPLYKEFHLDEPWDSDHNKALISKIPVTYRCPTGNDNLTAQGKTRYLTPRGKATIFPGTETIKLRDVTDGTSNTIMVIDAGDANAVIWSKPDDWDVDAEPDTAAVFRSHSGSQGNGSNFGIADGSIRFLSEKIKPAALKALLSRNGGEVINWDDL
jgi:Protein of unknown function (DUF1559)